MSSSLAGECTPLKHEYDACFNAWFEGYIEPIAAETTTAQRRERSMEKALEYEEKCGKIWESYRDCVQNAVKDKGLTDLLEKARQEDPLVESPAASSSVTEGKTEGKKE